MTELNIIIPLTRAPSTIYNVSNAYINKNIALLVPPPLKLKCNIFCKCKKCKK